MFRTPLVALLAANPAFVELSGRSLKDGGYNVAALSSPGALTTFLRISPVDVVVLDSELPGSSTVAVARGLRALPRPASPLFSIVALARDAHAHDALHRAGVDVVLQKPVAPGQLLATVQNLHPPRSRRPAARRPQHRRDGNVIHLFG
jgi:CheY-like chemotaxis protein